VEVAGIEPASKEPLASESTCLVVFSLSSDGKAIRPILNPARSLSCKHQALLAERPYCYDAPFFPDGTGRWNVSGLCC